MDLLPDDVLADILRRLAPCSLAASRCVRKSWCAIIDARRLLRADLLPLQLDGFFCLDDILDPPPYFFSRSRSIKDRHRWISGKLDFLGTPLELGIMDHCNGLLLIGYDRVVNPATRQWVRLPPSPDPSSVVMEDFCHGHCLVYDPVVSPHYEVVLIHLLPGVLPAANNQHGFREDSEWPPSPYTTRVFSSRSWSWQERSLVRQGDAVATIADRIPESRIFERHSVYLRGNLYIHCENHTVMRITLSNDKYRVIKCPTVSQMAGGVGVLSLGKSEKGVYCGVPWNDGWPRFQVWFLNEESSCEHIKWVLKSNISLQAVVQNFPFSNHNIYSSWAVTSKSTVEQAGPQEEFEWDSDDGDLLETEDGDNDGTFYHQQTSFLGFHPYKEIAFFWVSCSRVVSYHLNTSNVQDLGIINTHSVSKSFPYTSCWIGELHENN